MFNISLLQKLMKQGIRLWRDIIYINLIPTLPYWSLKRKVMKDEKKHHGAMDEASTHQQFLIKIQHNSHKSNMTIIALRYNYA